MNKNTPRIAIIGAGLAGLTTAYRLYKKGYNIKVFEARNRVGGRVHSIALRNDDANYSIGELGAQNIMDGGNSKYILSLIKELDLNVKNYYIPFSRAFFDKKKLYDTLSILQKHNYNSRILKKTLDKLVKSSKSIQEILDVLFPKNSTLKRLISSRIAAYEGSPTRLLSTYHNTDTLYKMRGGASHVHQASLIEGNATLPMKLAQKLHGKIYLKNTLKAAKLLKNKKIELTFSNNSRILCDKLILAIPCSIYHNISFDPKLIGPYRLKSIKDVQYGSNAKILMPVKNNKNGYNSILTNKMGVFHNIDKKLLNIYFIGTPAKKLLQHLQKHYLEAIKVIKLIFILSKFTNKKPIPAQDKQFTKYDRPVAKSWVEDPYSKGAYSNYGVKLGGYFGRKIRYKNIKVKAMFEPINDRIFFIGEHATILDEIGTMEAAVESGERISKLFKRQKK